MQSHDTRILAAAATGDTESLMTLLRIRRSSSTCSSSSSSSGVEVGEATTTEFNLNRLVGPSQTCPILVAASKGHFDAVVLLTALLKAAQKGFETIVSFLIDRLANVNHADNEGWTALHNAASGGFYNVAKCLVENGASVDAVSRNHRFTPLMNASSKGYGDVVQLLLSKNASTTLINKHGDSAFALAAQSEHLSICHLLASSTSSSSNTSTPSTTTLHSADIEIVFETQSSTLFHSSTFTHTSLIHKGSFFVTYSGLIQGLQDIKLPTIATFPRDAKIEQGDITLTPPHGPWFWLTDWKIDLDNIFNGLDDPDDNVPCDEDGWRYKTPSTTSKYHSTLPHTGFGALIRRRRWIRIRKRKLNLSVRKEVDYLDRARTLIPASGAGGVVEGDLKAFEGVIQVLLAGIKVDGDERRKKEAVVLVTELLERAEKIVEMRNGDGGKGEAEIGESEEQQGESNDASSSFFGDASSSSAAAIVAVASVVGEEAGQGYATGPQKPPRSSASGRSSPSKQDDLDSAHTGGTTDTDWRAGILASAGWKMEGTDLAIDVETPAFVGLPLQINDTQGGQWTSVDALVYSGDDAQPNDDENDESVEPVRGDEDILAHYETTPRFAPALPRASQTVRTPLAPTVTDADEDVTAETTVTRLDLRKMSVASLSSYGSADDEFQDPVEPIESADAAQTETGVEIRVRTPTGRETPNPVLLGSSAGSTVTGMMARERSPVGSWQDSGAVVSCKLCRKRFTLFLRKHHCRWCGLVFCDNCSSHRVALENGGNVGDGAYHRVCDTCYTFLTNSTGDSPLYSNPPVRPSPPAHLLHQEGPLSSSSSSSTSAMDLIATLSHQVASAITTVVASTANHVGSLAGRDSQVDEEDEEEEEEEDDEENRLAPKPPPRNMSDSVMLECPVCQMSLLKMKSVQETEAHIAQCLTRSAEISGNRYIVQTLREDSGQECVICFGDMVAGERVARLNCLCVYHEGCIKGWFKKKSSCPVHYQ
ncbi:hypothetical protein BCR33DRAFT_769910 [Rhizoclosmatium globosum]|uniref:Ankyrin n=1 Tax=Rhizoclosmatium globosum TaxID=329046 RepID=A0A1Y2BRA5_9FUNG|nr:hypothetical protein BCR33DRAFT_769910 [Rhizoclosmatium globosum]|eukprot:ORY37280.1 hypothetical protein BCR33DRAFT_769910 [Rhizoclosmatium globosum]